MAKPKYSFEQWCIDNDRKDLLDRWDYSKNDLLPSDVAYKSEKILWFTCPEGLHESEEHKIDNLANGRNKTLYCSKCRSFAWNYIAKYGNDMLEKIWNNENEKSPWEYTNSSGKVAIFNCLNDPSHAFKREVGVYSNGTTSCPVCARNQSSFAVKYPDSLKYWSNKNVDTPYDYSGSAYGNVFWKCKNWAHDDYKRTLKASAANNFECPYCTSKIDGSTSHNIVDLKGQKFGELLVTEYVPNYTNDNSYAYWKCICSCGQEVVVNGYHLRIGHVTSCGDKQTHNLGDNNPNWRGGITKENYSLRVSYEYVNWRNAVYQKDYFTCQCCGVHGGILNAHHIHDFATYEDERLDLSNGITLCELCHSNKCAGSLHRIYGMSGVTEDNLSEYINNKRMELGISIPFSIDEYRNGNILKPGDIEKDKLENKIEKDTWEFLPVMNRKNVSNNNLTKIGFIKIKPKFRVKED